MTEELTVKRKPEQKPRKKKKKTRLKSAAFPGLFPSLSVTNKEVGKALGTRSALSNHLPDACCSYIERFSLECRKTKTVQNQSNNFDQWHKVRTISEPRLVLVLLLTG